MTQAVSEGCYLALLLTIVIKKVRHQCTTKSNTWIVPCGKVGEFRGESGLGMRVEKEFLFFLCVRHILSTLAYVISKSILLIN